MRALPSTSSHRMAPALLCASVILLALSLLVPAVAGATEPEVSGTTTAGSSTGSTGTAREPETPPPPPPRSAEPEPRAPEPTRPLPDLRAPLALAESAGIHLPLGPEPSDEAERAAARTDAFLHDSIQRDRITAGVVDGWYYELGRSMRREFRPDMRAAEAERRRGMSIPEIVVDELGRYAGGRQPPQDARGTLPPELRSGDAQAWEAMDQRSMLNAPVTWVRVDLRVTHLETGTLAAVVVIRSSGLETIDTAALSAARTALTGAPPDALTVRHESVISEWSFEVADVATDPTQVGCVDEPEGGVSCAVLGRGLTRTRLTLLRVVDAAHPSAEDARVMREERDAARRD